MVWENSMIAFVEVAGGQVVDQNMPYAGCAQSVKVGMYGK
jgi:hypothetical protein